jgi:hypothetical protein
VKELQVVNAKSKRQFDVNSDESYSEN